MRALLKRFSRPGVLSFAHARPADELFPRREYGAAVERLLLGGEGTLQYQMPSEHLKEQVVELMAMRGMQCTAEQVFLTGGAQHAMALLSRILLDPGDAFILEETLYDGIEVVTKPLRPRLCTVPCCARTGLDVAAVRDALESGTPIRFVYVIPDGHNPTGVSLPLEARHALVELSKRFGVPIVEDDAYGLLGYDGGYDPPLMALSTNGFYIGSFSKVLAPSLRLGWIVAPARAIPLLSAARQASDMDVASFTQLAVASTLAAIDVPSYLHGLRQEYSARRNAALVSMSEHFPSNARWHAPSGGLFVWVTLPEDVDVGLVLDQALEQERIAFVPGSIFDRAGRSAGANSFRLAFGGLTPTAIQDGVERLGTVLSLACGEGVVSPSGGRGAAPPN